MVALTYRELTQHYPQPGWVEHDLDEMWTKICEVIAEIVPQLDEPVAAIGITNQRETAAAWDRRTLAPRHRALVWQDRAYGRSVRRAGRGRRAPDRPLTNGPGPRPVLHRFEVRMAPGRWRRHGRPRSRARHDRHVVDQHAHGRRRPRDRTVRTHPAPCCSTSAGATGRPSCSSSSAFPATPSLKFGPSSGRFAVTGDTTALGSGVPIAGVAGDQQAALFGQACLDAGMTKNTYGTGSFVVDERGIDVSGAGRWPPDDRGVAARRERTDDLRL